MEVTANIRFDVIRIIPGHPYRFYVDRGGVPNGY